MASNPGSPPLTADERSAFEEDAVRLGLTAAGMGEYVWDLTRDLFVVSPRMSRITGLPVGPMAADGGASIYRFIHPDDQDQVRQAIEEGRNTRRRYKARHRIIRPDDGRTLWLENAAIAVGEPGEPPNRIIGVVQDISARKIEEDEREALVAELDHRVKNVLASVQSLAAQSARKTASLDAFLKTFAGRLEAMASAHTLLTATRWRGAEIGNIAAAELGGLAPGQARWEGPEVVLNPRATNALTLALHELATNAVKYGALSSETGRVEVTWKAKPQGGFDLMWVERGGPSVAPPTRRGFGSTLLERVTGRELGGKATVEFHRDGARAHLSADASALAAPRGSPRAPEPVDVERSAEAHEGASLGDAAADDIRGVKVLIVEDAVLLALELEAGLSEAGAQVVGTAASLAEALKMIALPFDVAVLDANLNGESVAPVAEALRERGTPFIIATGYGDAAAPEGFDAPVVRKPYNVHQIAAALVQALGR